MKFTELNLHPALMAGIQNQNYSDCTPIQEIAIPIIVEGKDVAGLAQTGTGKTAAFVLPLIERILRAREAEQKGRALHGDEIVEAQVIVEVGAEPIETEAAAPVEEGIDDTADETIEESGVEIVAPEKRAFLDWQKPQYVLVLVPTRELADQVYESVKLFGTPCDIRATAIYGGMAYDKQKKAIGQGVEFVVATPGRLIDLYKEHVVDLRQVRAVVFDEADRMFDMGFKEDMKFILNRIPRERQMLVFSATLNFDVLNVCYEFGSDPVEINVSKDQPKAENVEDKIFHVGGDEKPAYLLSVIKKESPRQAIVFSNFKRNVERITQFLNRNGIPAVGISSLMTQAQRNSVMAQFKSEDERNILVATDLAARGLDVLGVDMVINFELPDDPENYVHRIGRTGRAGAKGHAFSMVGDRDLDALRRIEDYLGHKVDIGWLDDEFILKDYVQFPREREMGPYPPRAKSFDKKSSGGGRDSRGRRNDRGGERGPRRDRPESDRGPRRPEGQPLEAGAAGGTGGGERQQRPRRRPDRDRRPSNRERRPDANGADKSLVDGQEPAARSADSHRDRSSGRHRSENLEAARPEGEDKGTGRKRNRNRNRRRDNPNQPVRQTQGRGASAPSRKHLNKQVVAKDSLGKKVSGFFKKIFGS